MCFTVMCLVYFLIVALDCHVWQVITPMGKELVALLFVGM